MDLKITNVCEACEENDNWYEDQKCVGSSSCVFWFHKSCLSGDIEDMPSGVLRTVNLSAEIAVSTEITYYSKLK